MRANGRRGYKMFLLPITASCCSCRADDIRSNDKQQHRALWHYINWPFKPEGQPASVQTKEPEPVNILTAMAENQRIVANETNAERKTIALAWLFHLVAVLV